MKAIKIVVGVLLALAAVGVGLAWGVQRAFACSPASSKTGDRWYSSEEQDRIGCEFAQLEERIRTLENINANLQRKVEGLGSGNSGPTVIQPERVIETKETVIREADNSRVEALEKRVGTLEKVVAFLQKQVLDAVGKTISLLGELLKRGA